MKNKTIRIGTRGSRLALYQANKAKAAIEENFPEIRVEVIVIHTKGDKILDVSLSKIGDKGLFTKELEVALLNNEVDMAVHSLKDLPTFFPDGLKLGAVLKRAEVRDALVSKSGKTLAQLGEDDVIATSSLRRRAQLLAFNPKFKIVDIRGNMNTRLAKMDSGYCDAMIMAATGLQRLGLTERITEIIDINTMVPAVSQGAIGIEIRENDKAVENVMRGINHEETMLVTTAERAFLKSMEGGCQIPIGCFSVLNNGSFTMTGLVADLKGEKVIRITQSGKAENARQLALQVAEKMVIEGAAEILDEIRGSIQDSTELPTK
ncbi:MAG: hydroxymethylbilane synthase [Bacteroidales bacterium]|nr:hydroxymethylbilane synthase [Bacteroidales bacterium]